MSARVLAIALRVVALVGLSALGACTFQPASIDFRIEQADSLGRVRPGGPVTLSVEVRDVEGFVHVGGSPKVPNADIVVEATNATFDQRYMTLQLDGDYDRVGRLGTYEVKVSLREHPGVVTRKTFKADWALIRGPEPEDIENFTVALANVRAADGVVPGRPYQLDVRAVDKTGRSFTIAGPNRIPGDRLEIATRNVAVESQNTVVRPFVDRSRINGNTFEVAVTYKGLGGGAKTVSFPVDFSLIEGPEPRDVASIALGGTLSGSPRIAPGEVHDLAVMVTDNKGRRFSTTGADGAYTLPWTRLSIRPENARFGTDGKVTFQDDYRAMVGKTFKVEIAYQGRQDAVARLDVRPDFVKRLPLMTSNRLSYGGAPGREGNDGAGGNNASSGGRGGQGRDGQRGQAGAKGPNIRVYAQEVRAMDGATRLALIEVRVTGRDPEYHLRRLDGPKLEIFSVGGQGGKGGRGGNGGSGGDGPFSSSTPRDGGDGGDGGTGGEGGRGGEGGTIEVGLSTPDLEAMLIVDSRGGPGGDGGTGGFGGGGGSGGLGSMRMSMGTTSFNMPLFGNRGNAGVLGGGGSKGEIGNPGQATIKVDPAANDIARRAPRTVTGLVLY